MKCPKCGNTKLFDLEEKNWVKYNYSEKEDGSVDLIDDNKLPEVTESCDEPEMSHAYCGVCGEEVDYDEFKEWAF